MTLGRRSSIDGNRPSSSQSATPGREDVSQTSQTSLSTTSQTICQQKKPKRKLGPQGAGPSKRLKQVVIIKDGTAENDAAEAVLAETAIIKHSLVTIEDEAWLSTTAILEWVQPFAPINFKVFEPGHVPVDNTAEKLRRTKMQPLPDGVDQLLLILNHRNKHWSVGHVDMSKSKAYHYDSMDGKKNPSRTARAGLEATMACARFMKPEAPWEGLRGRCFQQNNNYDCGISVIVTSLRMFASYDVSAPANLRTVRWLLRGGLRRLGSPDAEPEKADVKLLTDSKMPDRFVECIPLISEIEKGVESGTDLEKLIVELSDELVRTVEVEAELLGPENLSKELDDYKQLCTRMAFDPEQIKLSLGYREEGLDKRRRRLERQSARKTTVLVLRQSVTQDMARLRDNGNEAISNLQSLARSHASLCGLWG